MSDEIDFVGLPILNKEYILRHLSQEQIFEHYTGLPVIPNHQYKSPFRTDRSPGCNYYYDSKNILRFNDHAGYFHGDCFDAVAFRIMENASTKDGFKRVLTRIAQDFRLHRWADDNEFKRLLYNTIVEQKMKINKEVKISVWPREWNNTDKEYWGRIFATKRFLNHFTVYPCQEVYLNNNPNYEYRNDWDVAYCYDFGNGRKRIYFPNRKTNRFLGNTNILQGIDRYEYCRVGLIQKSYKDVIATKVVCHGYFPVSAVAPTNEKYILTQEDYRSLKMKADWLFSLYDFAKGDGIDHMSIKTAFQMKTNFNIPPLFFTNGRFKTTNFKAKDFSQFLEINKLDKTRRLVEKVLDYFEDNWFSWYDQQVNEELKWLRNQEPTK